MSNNFNMHWSAFNGVYMPNKTNVDVYRCYYVLKFQKLYNSYCKQYILYEISLNLAWLTMLIPLPPNKHFFLNLHIKN